MSKPILDIIQAFDVDYGASLDFKYTGSVYGYKVNIYNLNTTSDVCSIKGVWTSGTINLTPDDLSTLNNDTYYNASLSIYETSDDYAKGITTEESDKQFFRTVTTPEVSLNISNLINSSNVDIRLTYTQDVTDGVEKEKIDYWQVFVYDNIGNEYAKSNMFISDEDVFSLSGLKDEEIYTFKLYVKTVNKMVLEKEYTSTVMYNKKSGSFSLKTEDMHNGSVKIVTKVPANLYKLDHNDITYISDSINLIGNGLTYYDGLTTDENWSFLLKFRYPTPMKDIVNLYVKEDENVLSSISVNYEERYDIDEYDNINAANTRSFFTLSIKNNSHSNVIETNMIKKPNDDIWYYLVIYKKENFVDFNVKVGD